eukprot:12906880-Prorocentrum_lima.AAC.1
MLTLPDFPRSQSNARRAPILKACGDHSKAGPARHAPPPTAVVHCCDSVRGKSGVPGVDGKK